MSALKEILHKHETQRLESLSRVEAAVEALQAKNALAEVDHRSAQLDNRERDKHICLGPYQNLIMKSHAVNLYDREGY